MPNTVTARHRGALGLAVVLTVVVAASTTACATDPPTPPSDHAPTASPPVSAALASHLAAARQATAAYVTDLDAAKRDGYQIITPMMPEMGFHYLNPKIEGFHVSEPPILVYLQIGSTWQLGAVEWVFRRPRQPHPWRERPTAPSRPPVTTPTARLSRRRQRASARRRSKQGTPSHSGIPISPRCTSGSGTTTQPASTTAPIPWCRHTRSPRGDAVARGPLRTVGPPRRRHSEGLVWTWRVTGVVNRHLDEASNRGHRVADAGHSDAQQDLVRVHHDAPRYW